MGILEYNSDSLTASSFGLGTVLLLLTKYRVLGTSTTLLASGTMTGFKSLCHTTSRPWAHLSLYSSDLRRSFTLRTWSLFSSICFRTFSTWPSR